ncbi:hypothetical protein X801_07567 [Opisthorchis viverrini]|uniref:Protein kinase domain-containing protein n=1 Tax=Opisthorchis viverrini TaxID=6198 RepID=A0A1S8WQ58_OPIVI|nr:hypothetical protein X801_07567 [Opisthorchis viverrini]
MSTLDCTFLIRIHRSVTYKTIGRKSDIWALGVMLYLMVYSRSPFPQPTMQGRLLAIINPAVAIEFPPIENQGIYKSSAVDATTTL